MNEIRCVDVARQLPLLVVGDLSGEQLAALDQHAESCRACAEEIAMSRQLVAVLGRLANDQCFERRVADALPGLHDRILRRLPRSVAYDRIDSPLGPLFVVVSQIGLCGIRFGREEDTVVDWGHSRELAPVPSPAEVAPYTRQLRQYFAGERHDFDLPVDLSTVSPFTQEVLQATARVPFGRLATYRTIAEELGKPGATRAVGNALGSNPVPIVIPCHRVIRSDGSLGGYTGGLDIKRHLLALEGALLVG